ncbi:hypothetical protein [Salidesulfovibrio onnuriiensis]|uniref:hypothetical protein n=1 Tax=Salidesulfovibrio onnuriiensis TaxID=2583823 RepID=UPI0011C84381|nr:hypothetical protein [Salidesulfovibrio onnuriiensis]
MIQHKYDHFIKEKAEVAEADKCRTFGKGERREDFAAMWNATGTLLLAGLPGSGRRALAGILSERLGLPVRDVLDGNSLRDALAGGPSVVVLDDALFDDEASVVAIGGAGKVFYLMADAGVLARRIARQAGREDVETIQQGVAARLEAVEPHFMRALHFILQAGSPSEDLAGDVLEKVAW